MFSNSKYFSFSDKFSNTHKFSETNMFSESRKFSHTDDFSLSGKFTKSNEFDHTNSFSDSYKFRHSSLFSESEKFSSTNKFSKTNQFSKSEKSSQSELFEQTKAFTFSNQFSQSNEFSPSLAPIINDPECRIFEDDYTFDLNECVYNISQEKLVYVQVLKSQFLKYEQERNGSAIHLINCGIFCNTTSFVDCSTKGRGGAIYIENNFDIINNATFIDAEFIRCNALYGGAVLISTNTELLNVSFTKCHFESNTALLKKQPTNENKFLFSGSAICLIGNEMHVHNCTFKLNKGPRSAIQIYNLLNKRSKVNYLEDYESSILFIGCEFHQDEKSRSSINYFEPNLKKSFGQIEIVDSVFKDKLKKQLYYIDSKLNKKEKLLIKSCEFENEFNRSINIIMINELGIKKNDNLFSNYMMIIIYGLPIIILLITINYIDSKKPNACQKNMKNIFL